MDERRTPKRAERLVASTRRQMAVLMRASKEGFQAKTFHPKCDNKGPTVTIVKSGNNIFGGFTETSWSSKYIS